MTHARVAYIPHVGVNTMGMGNPAHAVDSNLDLFALQTTNPDDTLDSIPPTFSEQLRSKIIEIPETPKKTVNTLEIQQIDDININARSTLRSDLRTALPRRPDTRLMRVSRSAISSMGHSIKQRLYFFSKRYIQLVARCIRSRHRARAAFVALAGANL
jgi:hypothetical protein